MRRAVLIVALLGLVLLAAFLLTLETRRASAAPEREAPPRAEAQRDAAELVMPEVPPVVEEPARTAVVAEKEKQPETKPTASPASAPALHLSGTVIVLDEQGVEHPAENGTFNLLPWYGNSASSQEVAVHAGAWTADVARETESGPLDALGVADFVLGGRAAFEDGRPGERKSIPDDGFLALRVRWPQRSILHVRDRISGRELDPVLLVEENSWPENELAHPPLGAEARDAGRSPVALDEVAKTTSASESRTFFVRSPGYAWERIEIDVSKGGERFVELDAGGDLEVILAGRTSDPGARLRIYGSAGRPAVEAPLASENGTMGIEGLAPGRLQVRAEIGDWWSSPLKLGEVEAEITAGTRTSVRLDFEAPSQVAPVALAGVLHLSAAWNLGEFSLDFELLGTPLGGGEKSFSIASSAMKKRDEASGLYDWSADSIQPGPYDVVLSELAFHVVLDVPASGLSGARIEIPPPCDVAVACVDEDSGAEVAVESVIWNCVVPPEVHGWSNEAASWNEGTRRWTFRAPLAAIGLQVIGGEYEGGTTADLHAGANELQLRVAHRSGLTPILHDGQTIIPWGEDARPELEPAEGQEPIHGWSSGGGRITLLARQPGRYTLKIPPIPGYEPVPDEIVELEKGVVKEHVIELRRKL